MIWFPKHHTARPDMLGFLPGMLNEEDPRPAREQLDTNYAQGGGWRPFQGFRMLSNGNLAYPGDPPMQLLYETQLRNETIRFYDHAWVAIVQPDGSYEIARMD
jgi:hypothetical protein